MKITFKNTLEIRVQAQIYQGWELHSTLWVGPGQSGAFALEFDPVPPFIFDLFVKDGATGWEIARQLGTQKTMFTIAKIRGRHIVT